MTDRTGNLPSEVSSFVGRGRELAEITLLLDRHRLVTVTGVGGVGKSRAALRVATAAQRRFPDGVWMAELGALRDPELIAHAVGQALDVQDQSIRPQAEVLADFLAERRLLLVLDTCEHLIESCALLVEGLLRAAPGLRVLAVSRQPLEVAGERTYVLDPLPVPASERFSELRTCPSVRLFTDRAAAADPGFRLTDRNAATVARLCRGLDGIPLALELAAGRLRALTADQLADRLQDRFRLLDGPLAGDEARHATLRAAIGWSHELCEPAERLLWARLSVFDGDFDTEAAEQVCADARLPADQVAELAAGLVAKSVLRREEHGDAVRLRMLATVRDYGAEWLDKLGETHDLRRRHRDHYLDLARRCEAAWCGPHQAEWGARLTGERANLLAALDFCLDDPDELRAGLELAAALRPFWVPCGFVKVGRHYFERAFACSPAPGPELAKALGEAARLATTQGDLEAASAWLRRCRELLAGHPDGVTAGHVAYLTGANAMLTGDHAAAARWFEEAVERHRTEGDPGIGLTFALAVQGMSLVLTGELERAVELLEESRGICERYGEHWVRSYADYILGLARLGLGDPAAAAHHAREAMRAKRLLRDSFGTAVALDLLAQATLGEGRADRAARLLGAAQRVWLSFGTPQMGSPDLVRAREECERGARRELGERAYGLAFRSGHDLDLEAAIDYALTGG
ncbi:MAG: LuxR family transcriptional regulator [Streptosporangiales bacterium]|nr:LuxR family transcriptional regulator [Streptosporangiales bacterium]